MIVSLCVNIFRKVLKTTRTMVVNKVGIKITFTFLITFATC